MRPWSTTERCRSSSSSRAADAALSFNSRRSFSLVNPEVKGIIYGVLLSIPEKFVAKYEDEVRKAIGYGITRGVMLARSNRVAERVVGELKELPINARG